MLVVNDILKERRQYFVKKVQSPLLKSILRVAKRNNPVVMFWLIVEIIRLCKRYPEIISEDDLVWNNSKVAFRVFGKIAGYHKNKGRQALVDAVARILIGKVLEADGYYEFLHDYYIMEMLREGWQPEHRGFPMYRYWTGPLYSDNWTETNADWLIKRRNELIEQADNNLNKVQGKIEDGTLWYFNLKRFPRVIEKEIANVSK